MSKKFLTIRNGILLTPQSPPPSDPSEGDFYFDSSLGLQIYQNGAWQTPSGAISNSDRNSALLGGGTIKWKESTTTLSWSKDAFLQVPGTASARNKITTGSLSLPNDGDVAYVDVNRESGAAATLTPVVINISALGIDNPTNESRFVIARNSGGEIYWGLQDGQRISTDGGVLIEKTLTDNTTAGFVLDENAADNDTLIIKYSLKRGSAVEVGHLYVTNNGTIAGLSGSSNELSTVGVTFQAVINGINVELQYDTTNTGTDVEMRYIVEKWDAS